MSRGDQREDIFLALRGRARFHQDSGGSASEDQLASPCALL